MNVTKQDQKQDVVLSYRLRLWIENTGTERANQVQVFVSKVFRRDANREFAPVANFVPINCDGLMPETGKTRRFLRLASRGKWVSIVTCVQFPILPTRQTLSRVMKASAWLILCSKSFQLATAIAFRLMI